MNPKPYDPYILIIPERRTHDLNKAISGRQGLAKQAFWMLPWLDLMLRV